MERELSLEFVRGLAQAVSGLRVRDEEKSIRRPGRCQTKAGCGAL